MKAYVFPGQGSQYKGMGRELFNEFSEEVRLADDILGYSVQGLCLENAQGLLNLTQYTQPALFVVNALSYMKILRGGGKKPDYLAGHSLGEYNALLASGAVDFESGLRIVKKRGELMAQTNAGGMAAVIGISEDTVREVCEKNRFTDIDFANYNSPSQLVLSGNNVTLNAAKPVFEALGAKYVLLNVSAAFHSRYMEPVKQEFAKFLEQFTISEPDISIIANVTARPYKAGSAKEHLIDQIAGAVNWTNTIRYLLQLGEMEIQEVGPGNVLTNLTKKIQAETDFTKSDRIEITRMNEKLTEKTLFARELVQKPETKGRQITTRSLGSEKFKRVYGVDYAYVLGAMYRGISSKEMVVRMGKAKMIGFLGTGGMSLTRIENDIQFIQSQLNKGESYGANLLNNLTDSDLEDRSVDLFLMYKVKFVEAAAYMQNLSLALVRYRLSGLHRDADGRIVTGNKIIAKISRPEVATAFMSPPPKWQVEKLLAEGRVSKTQAELSLFVPMADDLCVEADSGGHTDQGVAYVLMPGIRKLRDEMMDKYNYQEEIRIGAAGGIGTPDAAAAAFMLGADFIVTGSINQCTVEAGTSAAAKDLLQEMNVRDTSYAPAGDMFEIGAKVQVLKKGVFFPMRANKLYETYMRFNSLEEIDDKIRKTIEEKYFCRTFDEVYAELCKCYAEKNPERFAKAERLPKHKMAMVFRWYFSMSAKLAMTGSQERKVDYQIHTGPALGAFNQWVKGTPLEDWRNRHVDDIAKKILSGTAQLINDQYSRMCG